MYHLGTRVRLTKAVDYQDGGAVAAVDIKLPAGATGTIVNLGDDLNHWVIVKMDEHFACLDEFDNSVTFGSDQDSDQGIGWMVDYLGVIS